MWPISSWRVQFHLLFGTVYVCKRVMATAVATVSTHSWIVSVLVRRWFVQSQYFAAPEGQHGSHSAGDRENLESFSLLKPSSVIFLVKLWEARSRILCAELLTPYWLLTYLLYQGALILYLEGFSEFGLQGVTFSCDCWPVVLCSL